MQRIFKIFLLMLTSALVACGGGGGSAGEPSGTLPLSVNVPAGENPVRIAANTSRLFKISGGRKTGGADGQEKRSYLVNVDQSGVVALAWAKTGDSASEDLFEVIWVDGPKETKITVRDADDKAVSFIVKTDPPEPVNLYTTAPPALSVGVGAAATRTFTIGGGNAPYRVVGSDSSVATVTLVGRDQWSVTGLAMGSAVVSIFDARGTAILVDLTVGAPELRITPDQFVMPVGLTAVAKISGGQPPYLIAGNIPAAITAEIKGDELYIVGSLASAVDLTVADSAGQTVKVEVEINTATTSIRLSPSSMLVSETDNQPLQFNIFGAVGDVCVFSSNPSLLRPTNSGCTSDRKVVVDTGPQGNRCVDGDTKVTIRVVDSASSVGESEVTVVDNGADCGLGTFSVSPSTLNITGTNIADVRVVGAKDFNNVTATTANAAVATATVDKVAGVVRVKGVSRGTTTILVVENTMPRRSATITVNVN